MRKKIFNIIVILICVFVLVELLIKKSLVYSSILYALDMWINNLVPALFPFFIISDILINYNITGYIPNFFRKICKFLFGITDNMLSILILSLISGFPSNARNTRILYDKGEISLDEANHILIFSHFSNPIFILTTVGVFFFGDEQIGVVLLISHYVSNFLLAIFFRSSFNHNDIKVKDTMNDKNFGNVFITSIKKAIDTILLICGIVVVFLMLASILINTFNFNVYNSMIIKGIFEITIGIQALSRLDIDIVYKAVIASCFLAFGGISVHIQVISQIIETKIKYSYFFVGRLLQTIISGFITYIICVLMII